MSVTYKQKLLKRAKRDVERKNLQAARVSFQLTTGLDPKKHPKKVLAIKKVL